MPIKPAKKSLDQHIAIVVILLMATGTVFVFSASADLTCRPVLKRFYEQPGLRQILFLPFALLAMFACSHFDYKKLKLENILKSPVFYLLILSIALLILVLLPAIGTEVNYARRWLRLPIGPITLSFQPSELAKWALLFFLAAFCDRFQHLLNSYWKKFIPICIVIAAISGLIVVEDFGTAVFVTFLAFLVLLLAGVKFTHILSLSPLAIVAFSLALFCSKARISRITAFLNPGKWAGSANYQAHQSLIAIGSGRLLGKGLGKGVCKYGHLPEDTTDFIFAIIAEELGFIGAAAVIILYIIFIWLGIVLIIRTKDRFGQLLAAAIVIAIGMQAAINIGVVTVMMPTKGLPLPFISAGGSSLLLSAAAAGILMNIARQSSLNSFEENF